MKLLEALAESNFKIYTNYECNYELILQILSYYNVIAETFTLSLFYITLFFTKKSKIYKNPRNIFFSKNKHFSMHTLNFFSQQMLLYSLKLLPTNVAASIEMENNGSFEM